MAEVKGSLLLDVVRLIRLVKDRDWKKYLNEKDLEIIHSQILPSNWYPLETYERAELAIFHEIGQGKLEAAKAWGRFAVEDMAKNVYQNLLEQKDPMAALEKFTLFKKQLFRLGDPDFQAIILKRIGPNHTRITIQSDRKIEAFEAYAHQVAGSFERLVELAGGREARVNIAEFEYKGNNPYAILDISWQ